MEVEENEGYLGRGEWEKERATGPMDTKMLFLSKVRSSLVRDPTLKAQYSSN